MKVKWWHRLYARTVYWAQTSGLRKNWGRAYRWMFESKAKKALRFPAVRDQRQLETCRHQIEYRRDGLKELFDAQSSGLAVEYRRQNNQEGGDCEDIALWNLETIKQNVVTGIWDEDYFPIGLLSIQFLKPDGRLGGHAVTLLSTIKIGSSAYAWVDYHAISRKFSSVNEIVNDVVNARQAQVLAWSLTNEYGEFLHGGCTV